MTGSWKRKTGEILKTREVINKVFEAFLVFYCTKEGVINKVFGAFGGVCGQEDGSSVYGVYSACGEDGEEDGSSVCGIRGIVVKRMEIQIVVFVTEMKEMYDGISADGDDNLSRMAES
ncbi:predicted protein [Sclerotinia sclerotiorum 1980 UF-70]|uniref:Uncharacterized protein n=1 Tax=Sclerotinia sclerotiorum (strain ATCC 18683 / 1980 / Ss-1) TaxID=665079 RepID=A7ESK0_SCLS1|nr:predicted protein [Sclerotinia sclerotiorum 1980 UF-70]EDN92442.1 predicted protein [Sclerotinia sclerotiorum 1980 UF-70]